MKGAAACGAAAVAATGLGALVSGCGPTLMQTRELMITDGSSHHYTMMEQFEGEKILEDFCCTYQADREEAWFFFKARGKQLGMFMDIGEVQDLGSVAYDGRLIYIIAKEIGSKDAGFRDEVSIVFYHIHPMLAIVKAYFDICVTSGFRPEFIGRSQAEVIATPSSPDIKSHLQLESYFKKHGVSMEESRVITPTGTFAFCSTPDLIDFYNRTGDEGLVTLEYESLKAGFKQGDVMGALDMLSRAGLNITFFRRSYPNIRFPINFNF